ncbi:MAG: hypothetical protein M1820_005232 [Bogoriella megaspora]|nr:MAG: hypothetical protein M1820_005232 [Bogoriella megaspora]
MASSPEALANERWISRGKVTEGHFRYGPMVEVQVGKDSHDADTRAGNRDIGKFEVFHLYEKFASRYSGFFRKALNGDWKESRTRVIKLPEDDLDIFSLFASWIMEAENKKYRTPVIRAIKHRNKTEVHLALYFLADKLDVPILKDRVINHLWDENISMNYWWDNLDVLHMVYSNTVAGSKLRRLAVHQAFKAASALDIYECMEEAVEWASEAPAFYGEFAQPSCGHVEDCSYICDYHQHAKNELCKAGLPAEPTEN